MQSDQYQLRSLPIKLRSNRIKAKVKDFRLYKYSILGCQQFNDDKQIIALILEFKKKAIRYVIKDYECWFLHQIGQDSIDCPKNIKLQFQKVQETKILPLRSFLPMVQSQFSGILEGYRIMQIGYNFFAGQESRRALKYFWQYEGFRMKFSVQQENIYFCIQPLKKIIGRGNLLEFINKTQIPVQELKGKLIKKNYGNRRVYKIEEINFDLNPLTHFEELGAHGNHYQYIKKCYGIKIKQKNQPLLKVIQRWRVQIKQGTLTKEIKKYVTIYLCPELVSFYDQPYSRQVSKAITRPLNDMQIYKSTQKIKQQLKVKFQSSINEIFCVQTINEELEGYELQKSYQFDYKNIISVQANQEIMQINEHDKNIKNVVIFCPNNKALNYCENISKKVQQVSGSKLYIYKILNIQGLKWNYIYQIFSNLLRQMDSQNIKLDLAIFVIQNKLKFSQLYPHIKKLHVISQFVVWDKNNQRKLNNLSLQITIKLGYIPIRKQIILLDQKYQTLFVGIRNSTLKNKRFYSFCGFLQAESLKCLTSCMVTEDYHNDLLVEIFFDKYFESIGQFEKNRRLIIIREGINQNQARIRCQAQLQRVQTIYEKLFGLKINCQIFYLLIQNTPLRLYQPQKQLNDQYQSDKGLYIPTQNQYGQTRFYLLSEGLKSRPKRVTLISVRNAQQIDQNQLINKIYDECCNYLNYWGKIKVPSCVQYAKKLFNMTKINVKQDILPQNQHKKPQFSQSFWYL